MSTAPKHEYDDDACCIHCGHDGAEESHLRRAGYPADRTPCPVWSEEQRAENRRYYIANSDPYDVY